MQGDAPGMGAAIASWFNTRRSVPVKRRCHEGAANPDSRTLSYDILLIAAPLLMLLSGLVLPQLRGPDGTELSVAAGHPGRYYAYVLLGLAGSVALIPAVYGIEGARRPRRARLGAIGGGLALTGAALSVADWGGELVKVEMERSARPTTRQWLPFWAASTPRRASRHPCRYPA